MFRFALIFLEQIRSRLLLHSVLIAQGILLFCLPLTAQQKPEIAVDGYITTVHSPTSFEVHGKEISLSAKTNFGFIGGNPLQIGDGSLHDAVQLGAYVQIVGPVNPQTKTIDATSVYLRKDLDRKLSGFGVIDKVVSVGPEPVFRADGYLLHIAPTTDLTFADELNSLADVGTNIWVHYEGERDTSGALLVSKATFLPAKPTKFIAVSVLEVNEVQVEFPHPANGQHKEKLRYSQSESRFRVIDDPALQEHIQRIGMSVVPAYQKALPDNHPSKIQFKFYAVDSESLRGETCTRDGMILLPKLAIDRLKSDDRLAAVLADGVAFDLQRQAVRLTNANRALLGAEAAGDVAGALVPGLNIPVLVGSGIAEHKLLVAMQKQRARIALAELNDAGYDLNQAPEAWRLLAPKNLPANLDTLKYPDLSVYQMNVIYQQYRGSQAGSDTVSALH